MVFLCSAMVRGRHRRSGWTAVHGTRSYAPAVRRRSMGAQEEREAVAADHYDAVIVGAGMVGAMCAYYATRAGLRVAVVERDQPAAGSSGACEGNLLLWDKEMEREFDLTRLSMREWHQVAEAIPYDFEYHHRKGGIMVIERPESMARAAGLAKELAATGVEVEELDAAALHEKEPSLAPDLAGGFFYPGDCQVEPRRAVVAVLRAAVDGGAELRIHEEVGR